MTLVASCCAEQYVLQVSDRQLTWPDGGLEEDDQNKAVFAAGSLMAFAYTGVALLPSSDAARRMWPGGRDEFSRVSVDRWLAEELSLAHTTGRNANELFGRVANAASVAIAAARALGQPDTRHAFLGVTYATWAERGLRPTLVTISNFEDQHGEWLPEPRDFCSVSCRMLLTNRSSLLHFSRSLPAGLGSVLSDLEREVERSVKRGKNPIYVARLLAHVIRRASDADSSIGKNLLVNCIPRAVREQVARGGGYDMNATEPNFEAVSFAYMREDGDDLVQQAPFIIAPGGALIGGASFSGNGTDIRFEFGSPPLGHEAASEGAGSV